MNASKPKVKFKAVLDRSDGGTVWHFLRFPKEKAAALKFTGNLRRIICTLNGAEPFQTSLFPNKGFYFLTLSKKLRDKLGVQVGDSVKVELEKDESKYGMPMPEEFAEVLRQDTEGDRLFNALSLGNQRLMLKLIVMVGDIDKRIHRGLVAIEHLKQTDGKFVYDDLYKRVQRAV